MENAFKDLFHDNFVHMINGSRTVNKVKMRDAVSIFLSRGTKASLILFKQLDENRVEAKLHIVSDHGEAILHSVGTVKDGKLLKLEPYEDAKDGVAFLQHTIDSNRKITKMAVSRESTGCVSPQ